MTQKQKAVKFIFQVPRGKEDKWRLYRKVLLEFQKEPSSRLWMLIEEDLDRFMEVAELVIRKQENRKNE